MFFLTKAPLWIAGAITIAAMVGPVLSASTRGS